MALYNYFELQLSPVVRAALLRYQLPPTTRVQWQPLIYFQLMTADDRVGLRYPTAQSSALDNWFFARLKPAGDSSTPNEVEILFVA